jgi:hypothetical protein
MAAFLINDDRVITTAVRSAANAVEEGEQAMVAGAPSMTSTSLLHLKARVTVSAASQGARLGREPTALE